MAIFILTSCGLMCRMNKVGSLCCATKLRLTEVWIFGVIWRINHAAVKNKPPGIFKRKLNEERQQKLIVFAQTNNKRLDACISYRHCGQTSFFFWGQLILPAANELALVFCGENTLKHIDGVQLSNNTMSHRMYGMAASVKIYCRVFIVWLVTGFGLVTGFIGFFDKRMTTSYSSLFYTHTNVDSHIFTAVAW
jgi:hypothetical protein